MPTYYRPKMAHVEPGGSGALVLIAAGAAIAAVAAVVVFIAAHLVYIAVCAGVFAAVIGGLLVVFRRAASPRRWAEYRYPEPTVRIERPVPAQAILAPPRAIEAGTPVRRQEARCASTTPPVPREGPSASSR